MVSKEYSKLAKIVLLLISLKDWLDMSYDILSKNSVT